MIVKPFQALAFVPVCKVADAFTELVSMLDDETDEILCGFLSYFEATWIGGVQRGRRKPLFEVTMWNNLERTQHDLPRTTNSLEGWHRAFDRRMGVTHPSICRLV